MDAANKAILERTKKTRSVSRSLVTKQINKLESKISNTADKTTVHEIYMQLISKFEELSTLDKEIENLIDIESLEEEIVTREQYRDKFIIWKIRAERYVESVSNTAIQNSVENQPQNITLPLNSTVSSVLSNQPRLPKLTLESFSGKDISSFPSFWARFKSAVHENSSLNDVDKFSYLKSVVTSDAELAIRGLTLTSENYAKAIKILENRFGRKELIVDFHMNRLLNLTPVRKSFDVIALRNLYDQLEINIRGLESLEISPDSYSCLLFPIIMKAIPPDLALEYNKKHNETQSQITDLIAYLRSEVESRERTELLVKPHDLELKNKNSYSNTKYFERTSHSYPQSNRRVQGHSRFHPSHKSFSSANELLTVANSNCLFCFENTHMSRRGESKRFILSVVGRIFDPIGILGPFVIKLKCLLQELWTLGVEWDSELPPKLRHKWQQWSSEAEGLTEIRYHGSISERTTLPPLSRGISAVKLAQNELWWHGPPWLKLTPDHWPNRHRDILNSELCSEELEHLSSVHVAVTQQREALVDINRFSSLKKLLKTTAWVFRFVNNARNIYKSMDFYITADEIQNAEYFWLKCVQSEFYSAEILALKQNEQLRSSSEIKSLVPYLDENNLLRLTGRLLEADLCFGEKHPVILPRRCKFTELLVIREHERIGHCGVSATFDSTSKNIGAKPADQLSGQLPRDRITQSPPFQSVGIDFTGAILVKDNQGTRKSYVSLFTCAVTRAVHLELVSDMSTKCFLLALRRFLARRGNCKVIYSDNARTFKAAERELAYFANILKDSEFQSFVADKGIHWKFIVERAPWWGGFYERLVKTIKDPLRKILGRALLTFEELSTILSEVEVIVNHRPLTYVENDPGEPEPLTPAHFLELGYGDSKYPIHFIELIDATTAKESYKKRKTYRTLLLKQLWRRWKEQYLLRLKTANHFKTPSVHKNLKLNDVVLVEGNVTSKLLWELGIIKEIFIGRDDNVRSCLVKTFKGLFKKPIQLLYPLEIV
ncbi:integrase catalytic domain-containing protein [Trichonephila clavipes]|uniref:Integrase catalytic domain-containing protein n=1 Tax=Trichonephila clavipes TaxID=2585209 RepID=A0A8X6SBI5_TRICX|nr:integrase catalytic domain-containing protein [Trichonephila clavipes]